MYASAGEPRVSEYTIPAGHAGIEATVRTMRVMGRQALSHPPVKEAARAITSRAPNDRAAALAIRGFLADRVRFVHDPPGVELIRTPRYLLAEIQDNGEAMGDCDDVAVLGAALGMAVGIPARYVLVGLSPRAPFEHVYTELITGSGAIELDTTKPAQMPANVQIHRVGRREA